MNKETWIIEPRDALIARDGRPFGATAGVRAKSLDFPFPSTTTGGARTRSGLGKIGGDLKIFTRELGDEVLNIEVRGALLAEIEGDKIDLLVHAPADCLSVKLEGKEQTTRYPLVPLEAENLDFCSNLNKKKNSGEPEDSDESEMKLHLLGTTERVEGKPQSEPRFWHWAEFEKWLARIEIDKPVDVKKLGHGGLTKEQRTHVKILDEANGYKNKANVEGGLFQTRGLEFTRQSENLNEAKKLALVVEVERNDYGGQIEKGIAPLGGERRVVAWRKSDYKFPGCAKEIRKEILETSACRLILLTPAIFEKGFYPTWLQSDESTNVSVEAIAVNRTQVISGWDFVKRKPKPTRRMCPAGTVLFLKLNGGDIGNWIDKTWFRCVSDDASDATDKAQNRKDGFGLAALGVWSGEFLTIEEALKR